MDHHPVGRADYLATLDFAADTLRQEHRAAGRGPVALEAWWRSSRSRWSALMATLDQAEREDWAQAAIWHTEWRAARVAAAEERPT